MKNLRCDFSWSKNLGCVLHDTRHEKLNAPRLKSRCIFLLHLLFKPALYACQIIFRTIFPRVIVEGKGAGGRRRQTGLNPAWGQQEFLLPHQRSGASEHIDAAREKLAQRLAKSCPRPVEHFHQCYSDRGNDCLKRRRAEAADDFAGPNDYGINGRKARRR